MAKPTPPPYETHHERDVDGRWHIWIIGTDKDNLPEPRTVEQVAKELVGDYDLRDFSISAETLMPGRFHLTEKGFKGYSTVPRL